MALIIAAARKLIQNRQGKTSNKKPMKKLSPQQKEKLKGTLKKVATGVVKYTAGSPSGQKAPAGKPIPKPAQKKETNVGWDAPLDLGFVKTTRKKAAIGTGVALVIGGIAYKAIKKKRN